MLGWGKFKTKQNRMKTENTIIYAPFLDHLLLQQFLQKGKALDPDAKFHFNPCTPWQEKIGTLDFQTLPHDVPFFTHDAMIASVCKEDLEKLDAFLKNHAIELDVPRPQPSKQLSVKNFTAVALMQLLMQWPSKYNAVDRQYTCKDLLTKKSKIIKGFRLSEVKLGVNDKEREVVARMDLGNDFTVILADVTAFSDTVEGFHESLKTPFDVHQQIIDFKATRWESGSVHVPNVNEKYTIENHLAGIRYTTTRENPPTEDWISEISITQSEQVAKLELSQWGIKARAEAYAVGRMVFGCTVSHERFYHLNVERGLVAAICYRGTPLFVAYVPQHRFIFE